MIFLFGFMAIVLLINGLNWIYDRVQGRADDDSYFGSSTYDTKEMSTLIDGIVSECRELDIETETPEKLALMCEEWGR